MLSHRFCSPMEVSHPGFFSSLSLPVGWKGAKFRGAPGSEALLCQEKRIFFAKKSRFSPEPEGGSAAEKLLCTSKAPAEHLRDLHPVLLRGCEPLGTLPPAPPSAGSLLGFCKEQSLSAGEQEQLCPAARLSEACRGEHRSSISNRDRPIAFQS